MVECSDWVSNRDNEMCHAFSKDRGRRQNLRKTRISKNPVMPCSLEGSDMLSYSNIPSRFGLDAPSPVMPCSLGLNMPLLFWVVVKRPMTWICLAIWVIFYQVTLTTYFYLGDIRLQAHSGHQLMRLEPLTDDWLCRHPTGQIPMVFPLRPGVILPTQDF
jgi:hypothetical protein